MNGGGVFAGGVHSYIGVDPETLAPSDPVVVENNHATGNGGGIYSTGTCPVGVSNCLGSGFMNMDGSTFSANTADGDGGGLWSEENVIANDNSWTANSAVGNGGGVAFETLYGTLRETDGAYDANIATLGGGAWVEEGWGLWTTTVFDGNFASDGAAIALVMTTYDQPAYTELDDCTVANNSPAAGFAGVLVDGRLSSATVLVQGQPSSWTLNGVDVATISGSGVRASFDTNGIGDFVCYSTFGCQ